MQGDRSMDGRLYPGDFSLFTIKGDTMFKLILGVVIGTLFADSIKKIAILVYEWLREKLANRY
jgi:hypothetical protein